MPAKVKGVQKGKWTTLEWSWNQAYTAWFQFPLGGEAKIRYGGDSWWNGKDGSKIKLDNSQVKSIHANAIGSLIVAKLQFKAPNDCQVGYAIEMGDPKDITYHF